MTVQYTTSLGEKLTKYFERLAEEAPNAWTWEVEVVRAYRDAVARESPDRHALQRLDVELSQESRRLATASGIEELRLAVKQLLETAND